MQELLFCCFCFLNSFALPIFDYGDIIWGVRGNASLMSELQVSQNKTARLILNLPAHSSATDALKRLGCKPLMLRRLNHRAVFIYKLLNKHFCHEALISFNGDFHSYNARSRSRNNIRKSTTNRTWGHWSSISRLDISLRVQSP